MLPEHAAVALVDADGSRQHVGLAIVARIRHVDERGVRRGVRLRLDRAGQAAHPVFADVEGAAPAPVLIRVAVRHRHLGQRRPIEDRPHASLVLVADSLEHEALARVHGVAEAPFLPANLLAVDGEAGAVRLGDRQRLGRRADADRLLVELLAGWRERHDAAVGELDDLLGAHVHEHDDAFDRPAVEID